jgi:hypothetical protein
MSYLLNRRARLRATSVVAASATIALVGLWAAPAHAAAEFDVATGTGFVGKGDVQLVFGWSNAQLQANAGATVFQYNEEAAWKVTCEYTTSNGSKEGVPQEKTTTTTRNVRNSVDFAPRTKNQITGFGFSGFARSGGTLTSDPVPLQGGACTVGQVTGVISTVTQTKLDQKLQAIHGGVSHWVWRNNIDMTEPTYPSP